MKYRTLEKESFKRIYQCYIEVFSDYIVYLQPSFERFQKMTIRSGVDLEVSIGMYDNDDLVGFILNGVSTWRHEPTAYNFGTGILKKYRGKKYSKKMFGVLKQTLLEYNFKQYLLEVIQTNIPAYTLYCKQGFHINRELACFRCIKENLRTFNTDVDLHFKKISSVDWGAVKAFWNSEPSWQNSIQAVEQCPDQFEKIGVFLKDECVGYAVCDPLSGEIVHIAVKKDVRREGIGSALLDKVSAEIKGSILRVINTDRKDQETMDFFRKNGFTNHINQYEMILELKE
jgi:ribosomal protein S18 acetylase RimI-like enzyme